MWKLKQAIASFVVRKATSIRVVGKRIAASLIKKGVEETKIHVQPVTVHKKKRDSKNVHLQDNYGGYKKIFLFLGRLVPVKNLSWFINATSQILKEQNYLLLIVGEGSERARLEEQVKQLSLEKHVRFESWTNNPEGYLASSTALVLPSLAEGYGRVVLEAREAKCPVIMTDVGVANYEVHSSKDVYIVDIGNEQGFIDAMKTV
jgi:glycosyltransferase involved in cell wall biosynthesis